MHDGDNHYYKGEGPAEVAMYHEKIYELNSDGKLSFEKGHVHGNVKPLDFSITKKNVTSPFIGSLIVFLMMFSCARYYKKEMVRLLLRVLLNSWSL